jgi:two-component system chemotaxis response regulator CheB
MCAVKAMIVDDSAVVRKHLSDLLTAGGIEVVATAADPLFAGKRSRWRPTCSCSTSVPAWTASASCAN